MKDKIVISEYTRTPIGSFNGLLSSIAATKLGAFVIEEILNKSNIKSDLVDEVIMGNVLSAGLGQAPARQAAIYGGLPNSVECTTINKMCGSGLKSIMLAQQIINSGDSKVIIAGGMENMSQAPHIIPNSRGGIRLGHGRIIDTMVKDGLWDAYGEKHMGSCAEICAQKYKFSREEQDKFTISSYNKSQDALNKGLFDREVTLIKYKNKKGKEIIVKQDEEPFRVDFNKISLLKPVFDKNGTITAANASTINDGAAAVLVSSEEFALKNGLPIKSQIIAQASSAQKPEMFTTAPIMAIKKVLKKKDIILL